MVQNCPRCMESDVLAVLMLPKKKVTFPLAKLIWKIETEIPGTSGFLVELY